MPDLRIVSDDTAWHRTYPMIRMPRAGESLLGYMLALDELNGFEAGCTFRQIVQYGIGARNLGPGRYLAGTSFNLARLAELGGMLPIDKVVGLTAAPLVDWLYSWRTRPTNSLVQKARFRLCPACIATGAWPIVFLFDQIEGCAVHGLELVGGCVCGEPIHPFRSQEPYRCHLCSERYADLEAQPVAPGRRRQLDRVTGTLQDLLEFSRTAPGPLTQVEVARAAKTFLALYPSALDRPHVEGGHLRVVVRLLAAAGASATQFDRAARAGMKGKSTTRRRPGTCPTPGCPKRRAVVKDGRTPGGQRMWACMSCGTRFTSTHVTFAFDPVADYEPWRVHKNALKLEDYRARLTQACLRLQRPAEYLAVERAFRAAGVPSAAPYQSDRAGLVGIVVRSNQAAGVTTQGRMRRIAMHVLATA